MNRKETAERIKIMQAFVDGKLIEFKDCMGRWCVAVNPSWNWDSGEEYRIKPVQKYRPFANTEECWQEMLKHQPFGWIKDKENGAYVMITKVYDDSGEMSINGNTGWDFFRLMNYYTFPDGNLLDREASRELTMLYQRLMEEEKRKREFVPYRTYFRSSMFNIIKWRRYENTYCKEKA